MDGVHVLQPLSIARPDRCWVCGKEPLPSIALARFEDVPQLRYVMNDRAHDPVLATVAQACDAAAPAPGASPTIAATGTPPGAAGPKPPSAGRIAGFAALLGVGCLTCLLPGLLAGGALGATFGALGAGELLFGGLAIALALAAVPRADSFQDVAAGAGRFAALDEAA